MIISCPDCGRQVSDRATACPGCGFPICEDRTRREEAQRRVDDRSSRQVVGVTDCRDCEARGFILTKARDVDDREVNIFYWCASCNHTGMVHLVQSLHGYWAVTAARLSDFTSGSLDDGEGIAFIGSEHPGALRYPQTHEDPTK